MLTFWASSLTLVQSGFSAIHMKYSCKASSFWPASLRAVAFKQWACKNKEGLYSFDRTCIVFPSECLATTARLLLTACQCEILQGIVLYSLGDQEGAASQSYRRQVAHLQTFSEVTNSLSLTNVSTVLKSEILQLRSFCFSYMFSIIPFSVNSI